MKNHNLSNEDLKFYSLLNILLKMDEKRQERNLDKFIEKKVNEKLDKKLKEFNLIDNDSQILLNAKQVIQRYGISRTTLERAIRKGLKFSSQNAHCKRLFKQKDLDAFFNQTINFNR
ncbi:helix-turn-helix domain-containing protein [Flavobacterium psychrophilum]|nr:helix-turn-helix domain-containing protein [Flavobacterium psychrophilum]